MDNHVSWLLMRLEIKIITMRKSLLLIAFALSTLFAKAQFMNPHVYDDKDYVHLQITASYRLADNSTVNLPQDATIDMGKFSFGLGMDYKIREAPQEAIDFVANLECSGQILDYYGNPLTDKDNNPVWNFQNLFGQQGREEHQASVAEYDIPSGGHYNWSWKTNHESIAQSGHIQVNTEPQLKMAAVNKKFGEPAPNAPMVLRSMINTGFPYDIDKYQGNAKYTVYGPDDNVVCELEVKLNFDSEKPMMEQYQEFTVGTIESAAEGIYKVRVEAPFLNEPAEFHFIVEDKMPTATSENGVDATIRLKEYDFSSEGKGDGWVYTGTAEPTYLVRNAGHFNSLSTMTVRSEFGQPGDAFSLTQTISNMPQGFYTLEWPVAYKPCNLKVADSNAEILASIEANGVKADAANIMIGAVTSTVEEGDEEYTIIKIPSNDAALIGLMNGKNALYKTKVTFEVKEDGIINLGVNKAASTLTDDMTVIGEPILTYHAAGLPYGKVRFPSQTEFNTGDIIDIKVELYDGVGNQIPSDNSIAVIVAPVTAQGVDINNPIFADEMEAGKENYYTVSVTIPEASEGAYALLVASLQNGEDFEVKEMMQIEITDASSVQQVTAKPANGSENIYTMSGVKLLTPANTQGVYIQGGKKILNSNK